MARIHTTEQVAWSASIGMTQREPLVVRYVSRGERGEYESVRKDGYRVRELSRLFIQGHNGRCGMYHLECRAGMG